MRTIKEFERIADQENEREEEANIEQEFDTRTQQQMNQSSTERFTTTTSIATLFPSHGRKHSTSTTAQAITKFGGLAEKYLTSPRDQRVQSNATLHGKSKSLVRGGLNLVSNSLRVSMEDHGNLNQWASAGKVVPGMVQHSAA